MEMKSPAKKNRLAPGSMARLAIRIRGGSEAVTKSIFEAENISHRYVEYSEVTFDIHELTKINAEIVVRLGLLRIETCLIRIVIRATAGKRIGYAHARR